MYTLLMIIFIVVCLLMILLVLLQPHHSEGLAGAFGGTSDSFFGTKAVPTFWKATIVLATAFILVAIVLNRVPRKRESGGSLMGATESTEGSNPPAEAPNTNK